MLRMLWFLAAAMIVCAIAGCDNKTSTPGAGSASTGKVKIGFVVKSATEVWFQKEWEFADQAAAKYGFELVKLEAKDADKVLAAIDNLGAQGAQGLIICSPDVKLGPAIMAKAKERNLKLLSVDDRLVAADGKPLTEVHHLGISATEIGRMVGQVIVDEMKRRGWTPSEVGAIAVNFDELETARQRIDGTIEILVANGFPMDRVFKSPWKTQDIPGALDAATITLTQHPDIKRWVAFSSNDDGVLGVVRATEGRGIPAENVIGVGINGTSGVDDLKKDQPTGFHASILLSPRKHGYETAEAMYRWIAENKEPPLETYTKGIPIDRSNFREKMKEEGLL